MSSDLFQNKALIGYTGYVGSTLLKQTNFNSLYRSSNINEIANKEFDLVVCAGAPAQKWMANKEPKADQIKIESLIQNLKTMHTKFFVLISTVDVFKNPISVNEQTIIEEEGLHPYGAHRLLLERFVENNFSNSLIVRLPGLVGPGLKKNVIYDFLNNNNLLSIDSRGVFQFYPMVNLWADIKIALQNSLKTIHLTSAPLLVEDIARECFDINFQNKLPTAPLAYDFQTIHAKLYGSSKAYQYSQRESTLAIRAYAQSEPKTKKE